MNRIDLAQRYGAQ